MEFLKDFFIFVCVWKPEDNPWELVLSFNHEVPGMQLWLFTWLQAPFPTEPFCRPYISTKLACGLSVEAEAGMGDGMDAGVCCLWIRQISLEQMLLEQNVNV